MGKKHPLTSVVNLDSLEIHPLGYVFFFLQKWASTNVCLQFLGETNAAGAMLLATFVHFQTTDNYRGRHLGIKDCFCAIHCTLLNKCFKSNLNPSMDCNLMCLTHLLISV